mgnify:CR=1 FL=1
MVYNPSLIIGDTSQLSYYFPDTFEKISSRNIEFENICSRQYDKVFILFAEQRTFLNESEDFFIKTNVDYTIEVINKFKDISNKIIIYSTSELWNKYDGCISLKDKYNYNYSTRVSKYFTKSDQIQNFY